MNKAEYYKKVYPAGTRIRLIHMHLTKMTLRLFRQAVLAAVKMKSITMLTVITFDRFRVIRDYLYERDENGEYFFGIPKGNKLEVYLLTSAEDLYEYLKEQSEGFVLLAGKKKPE